MPALAVDARVGCGNGEEVVVAAGSNLFFQLNLSVCHRLLRYFCRTSLKYTTSSRHSGIFVALHTQATNTTQHVMNKLRLVIRPKRKRRWCLET